MIAKLAIAIAAGAASALMFVALPVATGGERISFFLVCLTFLAPLPLMVAGLVWGPLAATIGGIAAASGVFAILSLPASFGFVIIMALPAWWLTHLIMLARPGSDDSRDKAVSLEWYPTDRILLWIMLIASSIAVLLLLLGVGGDAMAEAARDNLNKLASLGETKLTSEEIELLVKVSVRITPVMLPFTLMIMYTLNCWIAAKVAHASEHFVRPWPNLRETALPQMALVALSVAIAFSFSGGLFGILALTVASALLTAYAIVGFAVLHTVTLSSSSRPLWLGLAYAITLLSAFTVVAASLLGIADAVFGLRQRYLRGRPPPLPVS